jgi:hypothetical protein
MEHAAVVRPRARPHQRIDEWHPASCSPVSTTLPHGCGQAKRAGWSFALLFNAAVLPGAGLFLPEIASLTEGTRSVRACALHDPRAAALYRSPRERATTLSALVAPVPRTAGH